MRALVKALALAAALAVMAWYFLTRRGGFAGAVLRRRAAEEATKEQAEWFGRTGLAEGDERELPRYLRREFGEFLDEPGGLKAADLQYLGVHAHEGARAHYWRIPSRGGGEPCFATVEIDEMGHARCFSWGDRGRDNGA